MEADMAETRGIHWGDVLLPCSVIAMNGPL